MNDLLLLLLSLSLSGTVIAGLCFAVKAIWGKKLPKSALYYLWLIALVRLALPFSFEGALLNRIYEGDLKTASAVSSYQPVTQTTSEQTDFSAPATSETNPAQIAETVSSLETVSVHTAAAVSAESPVMAETDATSTKPFDFGVLFLCLWAAGFAAFCAFALTSYYRFAVKLKQYNRPADENVLEIVKQLGRKVKICQNPLAKTPMLIGIFKPTIILPDVVYANDELKGALMHELTHKRRHDLLYKWFALFVNAAHWFNPIVWLIRREVGRACELSCDETVIKNLQANEKRTYGETLINLAAAHRYPAGVVATTLCEEKQTLKERLSAIMTYHKKGLWNKVLSCVLIVAVAATGTLLGACGKIATSLPSELLASNANYPETVNILAPDFFKDTGVANADESKQQWLDEMSQRYGVDIHIFTNLNEALNSISSSASTPRKFVGLTSIKASYSFKYRITDGSYIPLDGYLADNPVWNALPEDFKSLFEVDGHIYAIPASVSEGVQKARAIHDEALQKTGTITDLKSFLAFAEAYKKITGNSIGRFSDLSEVTDILNAIGLYLGTDKDVPFSYDPSADCYVDWLTKPTAVEALEFLRELNNNKPMSLKNAEEIAELFDYGNLASKYVPYYDYKNCTELLTLNPEYPQVVSTETIGFAMLKDTPQPQETINLLVDILFGSEQSYLDCWLGSDNYILNSDGTLTIKMGQDSEGNAVPPCIPNLTGGLFELFPFSDANITYSHSGDDIADADAKNKARLKMFNDSLENGSLVKIPPEYQVIQSATYDANAGDVAGAYYWCLRGTIYFPDIDPDKTVQQLVDEYKAAMLALGGNAMLDEMNAAIGKKTAYYYG